MPVPPAPPSRAAPSHLPSLLELPRPRRALAALLDLRAIVASEAYAMTALTLGGYRADLLTTFDNYIKDCTT
jgi:hypothetical protein